jgi:hypothetical protein
MDGRVLPQHELLPLSPYCDWSKLISSSLQYYPRAFPYLYGGLINEPKENQTNEE